ncbi:MAG: imidazole glycerol phosphate synthase subunit HisH [Candidatus Bathyarchaeales archaeon]
MIIDYGVGNLYSIKCALEKVGFKTLVGLSKAQLEQAEAIILPGVGDFSTASKNLASLKDEIIELVGKGLPVFGICLGMQLLFEESEEGEGEGLALLEGRNVQLPGSVKVPHMGWNTVRFIAQNRLVEGLQDEAYYYFAHSYHPFPTDKRVVCGETTYGVTFASVIAKNNICGTQFHPEKSGTQGLKFLENFLKFAKR